MSPLTEKDLEAASDSSFHALDLSKHPEDPLPSSSRQSSTQPTLIRILPSSYRPHAIHYHNLFYHYWHAPIPLPAPVERTQSKLHTWWRHPLPAFVPAPLDERFQRWWLAPEHIWAKRRLRIVLWWTLAYFVLIFWSVGWDIMPPEAQREVKRVWREKVGEEGCTGFDCVKGAWETGSELMTGSQDDRS